MSMTATEVATQSREPVGVDRTVARLKQAQAVAGAVFSIFVLLHLSNMALAPLGAETFNHYMGSLRQVYQIPLVEIVLVLGPIAVHAIAGIWLWLIRRREAPHSKRPLVSRLHTWAGCFLLVFIVGHILAVRGSSYFYGVFPNFEGLAFSIWYFPAYFVPYYFLLALAGFYHATNGLRMLAARQGWIISRQSQLAVTMIAAAWIALSLSALGGLLFDVGNPADNDFARLSAELLNLDLSKPL